MRIRWICGPRTCLGKLRTTGEEFDVTELVAKSLMDQGVAVRVASAPRPTWTEKAVSKDDKVAKAPKDKGNEEK